jgi:hypothetical protein
MRFVDLFGIGTLLLVAFFGCAPNADNRQDQGTAQATTPDGSADAASTGGETVADHGATMSSPSSEVSPPRESPGSEPFIAEAKSPFVVIDLLSPGRLEVVDGCLTVTVRGRERATAVFPPGVKPEFKGNDLVAVSFDGRTIPLDQDAPIPGGFVQLSSAVRHEESPSVPAVGRNGVFLPRSRPE